MTDEFVLAQFAKHSTATWRDMPTERGWYWRGVGRLGETHPHVSPCRIEQCGDKFYHAHFHLDSILTQWDEWITPQPLVRYSGPITSPEWPAG